MPSSPSKWLLLVHRIPAKPDYLRVRIGRQLHQLGAVAVKNSVYVMTSSPAMRAGVSPIASP